MSRTNQAWNLESFVDALVVELDKTRETLSVKAINNPLSYTVKEMAMELQTFPTYDGDEVQFVTAQPGEVGHSTIRIGLSPITDRQVRESSKRPTAQGDIKIEEIEIDEDVKNDLRKVGITSVSDLNRIADKDVRLESVVKKGVSYSDLANAIRKTRRSKRPPRVRSAALQKADDGGYRMIIEGDHLAEDDSFEALAVINGELVPLASQASNELTLACPSRLLASGDNELVMVLDPYSVVKLNLHRSTQGAA